MSAARRFLVPSLGVIAASIGLALIAQSVWLPAAPVALAADEPSERPPVNVAYVNPKRGSVHRAVRMAAEIKPDREAFIYGKVSGYAEAHPLEVGTRVDPDGTAGQRVLVRVAVPELDAAVLTASSSVARAKAALAVAGAAVLEAEQGVIENEARVAQVSGTRAAAEAGREEARAALRLAETLFDRLQAVVAESPNLVAQDQVDKAQGDRDLARARLASAEIEITNVANDLRVAQARVLAAKARVQAAKAAEQAAVAEHTLAEARKVEAETVAGFAAIIAPFKGVIAERFVDTGDLIKDATRNSGAMPLFRVVADDKIRVRFFVSEPDAPMCKVGAKIELTVDALDKVKPYAGTITRIADALDPKTRTMEVEAEMPNPPAPGAAKMRADMFARVKVYLEEHVDALLVPASCVRTKKRKSSVMVVKPDGTVTDVDVVIGADDGHIIQIVGGDVDVNTKVVITGRNTVAKGERVNAHLKTQADGE